MKGILLAGGSGTRLHPMTLAASKQLLPVYDKPMVYYPLSTLMLAGIRDMLVISTPADLPHSSVCWATANAWACASPTPSNSAPDGIAQAFLIGRDWIAGEACALALGDNLIHGDHLSALLREAASRPAGATVFAYQVRDPERYGVVSLRCRRRARWRSWKSRPRRQSNWAVTGLYFYDQPGERTGAHDPPLAARRTGDHRPEPALPRRGQRCMWNGCRAAAPGWTRARPTSLLQAATFVQTIQSRTGMLVGCPEEVAFRMGYHRRRHRCALMRERLGKTDLGRVLMELAEGEHA